MSTRKKKPSKTAPRKSRKGFKLSFTSDDLTDKIDWTPYFYEADGLSEGEQLVMENGTALDSATFRQKLSVALTGRFKPQLKGSGLRLSIRSPVDQSDAAVVILVARKKP